jgi:hypothetical protein
MFPWNQSSPENCGCKLPIKPKSRSIFKRIASATGQWITDLLGVTTGQIIVRDGSTLGYYKPNCEGLVKVDTDGNASVGNVESLEGPAIGNPLGFGFLPYLELFDKSICDPDGGAPTEEQWMRIKALMPQWIATGEIAVITQKDCASEELRFDFLQPCPLPTNGCPPDGIGYLASAVTDVPGAGGCSQKLRRWYWVTGLSIPDTSLVKNESGDITLSDDAIWRLPVLKKRVGCWFFESISQGDLFGDGLLTFRTADAASILYSDTRTGAGDTTLPVSVPGYAEALAAARPGSKIYALFSGVIRCRSQVGITSFATDALYINGRDVGTMFSSNGDAGDASWGERAIEITGPTVQARFQSVIFIGTTMNSWVTIVFEGFQYTPK